jgi:hypothetical protein
MALPNQLARLEQTAETSLEIRSQVDRVLSGTASVNVYRDGEFVGEALRVGSTSVYSFIDNNIPAGIHVYTTNVVDGAYTGPISAGYSVEVLADVSSGFILMEDSGHILMEDSGGILMESGTVTPEPDPFMRDDFVGEPGILLEGRVPNITTAGRAWYGVSAQGDDTAFYRLTGGGQAEVLPTTNGFVAWANIDLPNITTAEFELVLQNTTAVDPLVTAPGGTMWFIELHLGAHVARAGVMSGLVYLNNSNTGAGGGDPISNLGQGGAAVKFNVSWGDGVLTLRVDDVQVGTMSVNGESVGNPNGDGWLYMEVASGNMIQHVEVAGESLA